MCAKKCSTHAEHALKNILHAQPAQLYNFQNLRKILLIFIFDLSSKQKEICSACSAFSNYKFSPNKFRNRNQMLLIFILPSQNRLTMRLYGIKIIRIQEIGNLTLSTLCSESLASLAGADPLHLNFGYLNKESRYRGNHTISLYMLSSCLILSPACFYGFYPASKFSKLNTAFIL